jgi:hypothetical protein
MPPDVLILHYRVRGQADVQHETIPSATAKARCATLRASCDYLKVQGTFIPKATR